MTERWERVRELLREALAREPGERAEFLDHACRDDAEMRRQIEALLVTADTPVVTGSTVPAPRPTKLCPKCNGRYDAAWSVCPADGEVLLDDPDALVDTTLDGLYQVVGILGRGGFGVVYLARHTLLRDMVAIKVLPRRLSSETDRVERFLREGRAARALHHPNAVTVYDLRVSQDGTTYMVLEYVDGNTLREEMERRGPVPADEAVALLTPIADALDEAHSHGIVHRDLKPENIMLGTGKGKRTIKLLDLGIAKLREVLASTATSVDVTQPGQVIGTPFYMPPEQWGELPEDGGAEIDGRADVYSLAIVVYELVSGRRPFTASTVPELRRAHLRVLPMSIRAALPWLPQPFERALARAMSKDRSGRQPTAGELMRELRAAIDGGHATVAGVASGPLSQLATTENVLVPPPSPPPRRWPRFDRGRVTAVALASVSLLALVAVVGVAGRWLSRYVWIDAPAPPAVAQESRFITRTGNCVDAAISPDGKYVVAVVDAGEKQSLQVLQVSTRATHEIVAPTSGRLFGPRFSPQSDYVLYAAVLDDGPATLYRIPVFGGTPQPLLPDISSAVAFSPDGSRFAFVREGPGTNQTEIMTANADGTSVRAVAVRSAPLYFARGGVPAWSPDGTMIACAAGEHESGFRANLVAVRVDDGSEIAIGRPDWFYAEAVTWLPTGDALVVSAQDQSLGPLQLWRVSYPGGDVSRLTSDLNNYIGVSVTADAGSLVTVQTGMTSNVWVASAPDASDAVQVTTGVSRYFGAVWTPDGRIVYSSFVSGNPDIWVMDANGANARQLTFDEHMDRDPAVSPDGRYVFFSSNRAGPYNIWRMNADGTGPVRITDGSDDQFPFCSPDGTWVVYQGLLDGSPAIWKVPVDGGESVRLSDPPSNWPSVSKDGRWVACSRFDDATKTWQGAVVSIDGGPPRERFKIASLDLPLLSWQRIRWAADGRALTYIDDRGNTSNIWAQPLDARPPRQVTGFRFDRLFYYDVSATGSLVCVRGSAASDVVSISGFGEPRR